MNRLAEISEMPALRLVLLLSWLAGIAATSTAIPRPVFEKIDNRDGLAHNSTGAILQDRRGFLWVGTFAGLNRFDGVDFVVWRHDPEDPESLSSNSVTALLEDRDGNLWVGTDRGLDRFEQVGWQGERFHHYPIYGTDGNPIEAPVRSLFEDREGTIWAGLTHGLLRRRPDDSVELLRHDPENPRSLASGVVYGIQQDSETLWVLTAPGPENRDATSTLNRLDEGGDFDRFPLPGDRQASGFLIDRSHRFWLNVGSLGTFDPESKMYRFPVLARRYVPQGSLWQDRAGALWISTFRGFLSYQPASGDVSGPWPAAALEDTLSGFAVAFAEDRAEGLWLGTRAGLYRWDRRRKPFRHLSRRLGDDTTLSGDRISALLEDSSGALWVATFGAGLNRLESLDAPAVHYRYDPDDPSSLCDDTVWHLAEDAVGDLWLGAGEGLCRYDRASDRFVRHPLGVSAWAGPAGVRFIVRGEAGQLWLASEAGLLSFDPSTKEVRRHGHQAPDAPGNRMSHCLYLDDDSLWLGAQGGSLEELNLETGALIRHPLRTRAGRQLRSEGIFTIRPGPDGSLWLGSGEGLSRYHPSTGELEHYTERHGLPGPAVYSILEDDEGRLWLGTDRGLSRYDERQPRGQRFRNFDLSDGVGNLEFNRHAALRTRDGRFHFGGMARLTSFAPDEILDNPVAPAVALTRVGVWNPDGEAVFHPGPGGDLVLAPGHSSVAFEFAALDFTNAARNRYAYRLEGFDEGWIDNGVRRLARYHRLPPGRYTFRVKGSNSDGLWNEQGASLPIRVLPPYWQTWWFRLAALASLVAVLVMAHRFRVSRLLQIERLRTRIAGDLHDDLSSELSGIALAMEVLQQGPMDVGQRSRLTQVRESSLRMLDRLRDIVWCVNPEHDNQDAVVRRMRSVAKTLLVDRPYRFESELDGGGDFPLALRRNLLLIYKEALHNAVRHSDAQQIEIRIAGGERGLRLAVVDDGIGFDGPSITRGIGIASMRRRAAEMGAKLRVTSVPGRGTAVRLEAPISRWRGSHAGGDA